MTVQRKARGGWQFGIVVVCICVGLAILSTRRNSRNSQTDAPRDTAEPSFSASGDGLSTNLAIPTTNQAATQSSEERVIALITEGNRFLEQENYAEAVRRFEQAVAISPEQEDLHY